MPLIPLVEGLLVLRKPPPTRSQSSLPPKQPVGAELLSLRLFLLITLALAAIAFAAYIPTLDFKFVLDDHRFLSDPRLQSPGHVWDYFSDYVWAQYVGGPASFYRPLFILWLRTNFIISEMSPWGWHFLSLLKHMAAAGLLALLVWKLLRDRGAVLIAIGLFALHPAQTESVAWVTVPDPLMSIAILGSLLLGFEYVLRDCARREDILNKGARKTKRAALSARPSAGWIIAGAIACLAAELVKETAVILPGMLFCLFLTIPAETDIAGRKESANGNLGFVSRVLNALRLSVPFLFVTLFYILLRFHALKGKLAPQTQHLNLRTLFLTWPATLWFYAKVVLWPVRLRAFADSTEVDTFSVHRVLWPSLAVGFVIAMLAGLLLWASMRIRRVSTPRESLGIRCALVLGVLLLVVPILPALNLNVLNPGDFLHGRYTYLPLGGMGILLATCWHLLGRWQNYLLVLVGLLMLIFCRLTMQQETAWKDDLTLFTMAHQVAPNNAPVALNLARAHVQVALSLGESGRCQEALPIYKEVTSQYPDDWFAWAGLGECFVQLNELQNAEQALHRAADISHKPEVIQQWKEVRAQAVNADSASPN